MEAGWRIYVSVNYVNFGSANVSSPELCQAIIKTNADLLSIGPLGTNYSEILIGIQAFSVKKMPLKMSSAKWWPFCFCLNVLIHAHNYGM